MNISINDTFKGLMRENRTFSLLALLTCLMATGPIMALDQSVNTNGSRMLLIPNHAGRPKTSDQHNVAQTDAVSESDDCD